MRPALGAARQEPQEGAAVRRRVVGLGRSRAAPRAVGGGGELHDGTPTIGSDPAAIRGPVLNGRVTKARTNTGGGRISLSTLTVGGFATAATGSLGARGAQASAAATARVKEALIRSAEVGMGITPSARLPWGIMGRSSEGSNLTPVVVMMIGPRS
jgi:hypothetical protein